MPKGDGLRTIAEVLNGCEPCSVNPVFRSVEGLGWCGSPRDFRREGVAYRSDKKRGYVLEQASVIVVKWLAGEDGDYRYGLRIHHRYGSGIAQRNGERAGNRTDLQGCV